MIKTLMAALVAGLAALPASAADVAERAQRFLDETSSLRAHFAQTLADPSGQPVQEAQGTLELKRPGRFRWEYAPPDEQVVVADGKRLWLYDPALEQVTVKAVDSTLGSTPAMLLSGTGKLTDAYEVVSEYEEDGLDWVELKPRASEGDFTRVRLAFAGEELQRMELTDALDQVTSITLEDVARNVEIDDARFAFEPPPGTDVIGDTGES